MSDTHRHTRTHTHTREQDVDMFDSIKTATFLETSTSQARWQVGEPPGRGRRGRRGGARSVRANADPSVSPNLHYGMT